MPAYNSDLGAEPLGDPSGCIGYTVPTWSQQAHTLTILHIAVISRIYFHFCDTVRVCMLELSLRDYETVIIVDVGLIERI